MKRKVEVLMFKDGQTQRLIEAVCVGDIAEAKAYLQEGADINGVALKPPPGDLDIWAKEGKTPLIMAVTAPNSEKMVRFLLEQKADVHKKSAPVPGREPDTALFAHIYRGRTESVRLLLDNGAGLESRSWVHNHTPLLASVCGFYQKPDVVQLLLERKADIHARSELGGTAVLIAAGALHIESLQQVLRWPGMVVDAVNKDGDTALIEVVKTIAYAFPFGISPESRVSAIKLLLEADADIKACDKEGRTVLDCTLMVKERLDDHFGYRIDPPEVTARRREALQACVAVLTEYPKALQNKIKRTVRIRETLLIPKVLADLVSDYDESPPEVRALARLSLFARPSTPAAVFPKTPAADSDAAVAKEWNQVFNL